VGAEYLVPVNRGTRVGRGKEGRRGAAEDAGGANTILCESIEWLVGLLRAGHPRGARRPNAPRHSRLQAARR
jgi:hypothetical protein